MRIIKVPTLKSYWRKYAAAQSGLEHWLKTTLAADWHNLGDTRQSFPHADEIKVKSGNTVTIFNIAGNNYRLIVSIKYKWGVVYIRDFLTHAEYDKDHWKTRH